MVGDSWRMPMPNESLDSLQSLHIRRDALMTKLQQMQELQQQATVQATAAQVSAQAAAAQVSAQAAAAQASAQAAAAAAMIAPTQLSQKHVNTVVANSVAHAAQVAEAASAATLQVMQQRGSNQQMKQLQQHIVDQLVSDPGKASFASFYTFRPRWPKNH